MFYRLLRYMLVIALFACASYLLAHYFQTTASRSKSVLMSFAKGFNSTQIIEFYLIKYAVTYSLSKIHDLITLVTI